MRKLVLPCALAVLLGFPLQPAEAADAAKTPGKLLVVHRDGLVHNQDPTFGGHFQLGVNPSKNELALYLGAALRIQKYLSSSASR